MLSAIRRWAPSFGRFARNRLKRGERYGLGLTLAFLLVVAALWLFLEILALATTEAELNALDVWVQARMAALLTPEGTRVVVFITDLGGTRGTVVGIILVGLYLLFHRRWYRLLGLLLVTGGGGLIINGLKLFFARARPVETVIPAAGYSFPSGHAFAATAFFGYVIYLLWTARGPAVLRGLGIGVSIALIVLIGVSRTYLNVHYGTDVAAGTLGGFVWLASVLLVIRVIEHRSLSETDAPDEPPPDDEP